MPSHHRPVRSGFTLIELLVVIAILGALIALLFPSLQRARDAAKQNVCLSSLKSIGNAMVLYIGENEDTLPPGRLKRGNPTNDQPYVNEYGRFEPRWHWFLTPTLGEPIDTVPFRMIIEAEGGFGDRTERSVRNGDKMTLTNETFFCPSLQSDNWEKDIRSGAYGYNYQYLGNARRDTNENRFDNFSVRFFRIKAPSSTIAVADSRGGGPRHGVHSYTLDPPRLAVEKNAQRFGPDDNDTQNSLYHYSPAEDRHRGLANVVFLDGHAESMTLFEMGYEISEGGEGGRGPSYPKGEPVPMYDAQSELRDSRGLKNTNNKLWTGSGLDEVRSDVIDRG